MRKYINLMPEYTPITDTPEIREQIVRIADSNSFRRRGKLLRLLEFLVTETMAGRGSELSQKKIAAEFLGIKDSADPQDDVAVRISASRLRNAIDEYYKSEAQADELRIQMLPRQYYLSVQKLNDPGRPRERAVSYGFSQRSPVSSKKISQNDMIGALGINLIQKICLDMGFLWHPTGLEAGIDGYIEIRLESGEVTNCIIQVQSKATDKPFESETPSSFEFRCSPKDLQYWLGGNAPVILVRSRPNTGEAYWISIKDYFSDVSTRKSSKIVFDKLKHRFDSTAKLDIQRLATDASSGLYLGTHPKSEIIYSNLLELRSFPKTYYVAATEYRTRGELFAALREVERSVQGEWILHSKTLTSFHDLGRSPWNKVCDRGSVEEIDTSEWARSDDHARQRQLVQLLNACLREKLYRKGVKFSRENQCYYFRASQDLSERGYAYQSRENRTSRSVFKGYPNKHDHTRMSYYRHSAFGGRFVRYGSSWYLQIAPTYHFTRDGERVSRFAPDLLSGIKRLETNPAVHGQVVMWAQLLTERNLFDAGPEFLQFQSLVDFDLDVGLDDDKWLKYEEDPDKRKVLQAPGTEDRQGRLIS
jgi:Domain of unknown function (DUF4365)